jgi:hypothetical protein
MKRRRSVLRNIAIASVMVLAIAPTLLNAVSQVLRGRGAAVYFNVYGLAIHYTSVLIFVAAFLVAVAVALIARLIYFWRRDRDPSAVVTSIETQLRDSRTQ